ncbi:MAG: hypothetical protein ACRC8S_12750 [Fimbriiglobus sp.]
MTSKFILWLILFGSSLSAAEPFAVEIVDQATGRPVPLVELRTTSDLRFVSDNAGRIAVDAPELMGREVWFGIEGHGYTVPADGFGYRGVKLTPTPGRQRTLKIERVNIAERLGRWTGSGLFAESQKLGLEKTWVESGIVGQDTVQTAAYRGQRFWLWGDTTLPHYPLGLFQVSAAQTKTLPKWEAPLRPTFDYYRDTKQRPRNVAEMPGDGPTWMFGLASVQDRANQEKLVGAYTKVRNHLESYEWGLAVWNDDAAKFDKLKTVWSKNAKSPDAPPMPSGHAVPWKDEAGKTWLLFCDPFPKLKVPATYEAWQEPTQWQPLETPRKLGAVVVHGGSLGYHAWLKKWVVIFTQKDGQHSFLGDVWYAESDSPFGPWSAPVLVLRHANYSFYNPRVHVDLVPADSADLIFEGTYTAEFARHPTPTARHNYNQVLYRLDLRAKALRKGEGTR